MSGSCRRDDCRFARRRKTETAYRSQALYLVAWFALSALGVLLVRRHAPWLIDYLAGGSRYVVATGYCNCEKCCGWELDESGQPVFNYGRMKGRAKQVGRTSSGTVARHGTVAADPRVFKMGTRLSIPGYGVGVVEDTGGSIKGRHIDLWFPTHEAAKKWGRRKICITKM